MADVFALPPVVELLAQAIGAASGAVLALRKGYDVIGVSALALAAGAGGGVIRDCLLQTGPPAFLTNGTNVLVQLGSAAAIIILHPFVRRFVPQLATGFTILDALSLSLFAIVGLTKAQACGLAWPAVVRDRVRHPDHRQKNEDAVRYSHIANMGGQPHLTSRARTLVRC